MSGLDFQSSQLNSSMDDIKKEKLSIAIQMFAVTKAPQLQAYMQTHRPWTDRTGMAKATLRATVSKKDNHTVRITLSHGVDYGIWLELAHEKRYAIIAPTLTTQGPKLYQQLAGLLSKIK